MHSIDCPSGARAHFNSDFSGDIVFTRSGEEDVTVPAKDLISVVAEFVRRKRITEIENAKDEEVLLLGDRR